MLRLIYRLCGYLKGVLIDDKMPVWLTLVSASVAAVVAAYATYKLAPSLNAQFEATKVKSQYVLENLKAVNSDTADLLSVIGEMNRKAIGEGSFDVQQKSIIAKKLTALQWRAIEYDILFEGSAPEEPIKKYRAALEVVRAAVASAQRPADVRSVIAASEALAISTHELIALLSKKADIQAAFRPW